MCKNLIERTIYQEVAVASELFQVPPLNELQSSQVVGVMVRRNTSGNGRSLTRKTIVNDAVLDTAHLLINSIDDSTVVKMPLAHIANASCCNSMFFRFRKPVQSTGISISLDITATGYNAAHVIELTWLVTDPATC